jgi:hypothetical protein
MLTLTTAPAKADTAASNGETLHLLNRTFGIGLADELDKTAMLADRDFDLEKKLRHVKMSGGK